MIIKGALNIALHYKISEFFIGLTILAIGTDLPELVVGINGSINKLSGMDTSGLIVGQAIGSCLGQIGLVLGIIGLFGYLKITKRQLLRDGLMLVGSVVLFFLIGYDGEISRVDGAVFIVIYIIYFFSLYREEKVYEKIQVGKKMQLAWAVLSLLAGFALLILCSDLVIDHAVKLANIWGVSQSFVGILIIGLGTSLPELVVSLSAIRKRAIGLSIGNLIGSNIFDILFALGIGSVISGFKVNDNLLYFDIPFLFLVTIMVMFFFRKDKEVEKKEAALLVLVYVGYVVLKVAVL